MKCGHVSIDTFSGAVYASAHAREEGEHVVKHLLQAFPVLGVPKEIKTDNGPAYISKVLNTFLQNWGVEHKYGIPHSATRQAVIEQAHQSLKRVLEHQQESSRGLTLQERICKALFTINFLNCSFKNMNLLVVRHFSPHRDHRSKKHPRPNTGH